jgi:hypothetical protein
MGKRDFWGENFFEEEVLPPSFLPTASLSVQRTSLCLKKALTNEGISYII